MAQLRSIRRKLRRFAQIGRSARGLTIEAAAWLLLARLALIFVPFPLLARRLGTFVTPTDVRAVQAGSRRQGEPARIAEEVGWAVSRSARYVPFKAVCLPQAIAARMMLKRRGVESVLYFGGAKGQDMPFDTHAWLRAAGVDVTGYPAANRYAEIACLV